jgi:hypothetical protein
MDIVVSNKLVHNGLPAEDAVCRKPSIADQYGT